MQLFAFSLLGTRRALFRAARHSHACQTHRQQQRCASVASGRATDTPAKAGGVGPGDVLQLTCTGLSSGGEGVCRTPGGVVVFVERALPGEVVEAQVIQSKKSFARAVKLRTLEPHGHAVAPPCQHFGPCGGCSLQSLEYEAQLRHKHEHVVQALEKIGRVEGAAGLVRPVLSCLQQTEHRNKMEFSFSTLRWVPEQQGDSGTQVAAPGGAAAAAAAAPGRQRGPVRGSRTGRTPSRGSAPDALPGFSLGLLRPGSNSVVLPISECRLQPGEANALLQAVGRLCEAAGLQPYNPASKRGLLQALVIRTASGAAAGGERRQGRPGALSGEGLPGLGSSNGSSSNSSSSSGPGEILLSFVTARDARRELAQLLPAILQQFSSVVGVVNTVSNVSRPAGERTIAAEHLLHGRAHLVERLCGLEFEVSANSFFQTNTRQAERLYELVAEAAELRPSDVLLDMYCGTGSIGLALAARCAALHGVEVVAPAVRDARRNAERNGIANATFWLADLEASAGEALLAGAQLPAPDVVVVDPARPGLSPAVVSFLRRCGARRVVYVSCNPATQARDIALLCAPAEAEAAARAAGAGPSRAGADAAGAAYRLVSVQPVDMFPHTMHVESVAVLDRV